MDDDLDAVDRAAEANRRFRPVEIHDDVVMRPASAASPTVHSLLTHLRARGIGVPEPLGIREGRETLRFLEGESGGYGWFHQHTDEGLASAAGLPAVPDRRQRVRVFLDAYGGLAPFDVAEAVSRRMRATRELMASLAADGVEPQRTWVADGALDREDEEISWVLQHRYLMD